ncbi:cation:proton antiporter [Corynebacterium kutscheri]|nr:cation:proton antiporter [Corynebacterium kutscheri]
MSAAFLAPLISYATGKRIPAVVLVIAFGVIIGPHGLGLASETGGVSLLKELGLGMLFLLAGYEIDPDSLRSKEGKNAAKTWLLCAIFSFIGAYLIAGRNILLAIVLALAMTSTAIGTLLPILKQQDILEQPVGKSTLIHGAIGEVCPILAMALLLSARATWLTAIILLLFTLIAIVVALVPRTVHRLAPWVSKALLDSASSTNQSVMRLVILILAILMAVAAVFELDVVLGAFAAGFILRQLVPIQHRHTVADRLDIIGYGLFIPVFFVCSGMNIDPHAVAEKPWLLLTLIPLIYITRGLPVFLREKYSNTGSGINNTRDQIKLSLYSATALPIIVAVTEVATSSEIMSTTNASMLVAAGAVTVLVFPLSAALIKPVKIESNRRQS